MVEHRGSRTAVLGLIGAPLLLPMYGAFSGLSSGGWEAIGGWICLLMVLAGIAFIGLFLVDPPRLQISSGGFAWKGLLRRAGVQVNWADVAEVGPYTRQVLSVRGEVDPELRGIGYRFKPTALTGKRERQAMANLGVTGWHGVITGAWGCPTGQILREFRDHLEASRSAPAPTSAN